MENQEIKDNESTHEVNPTVTIAACPTNCSSQISRIVNFCCSIELPQGLGLTQGTADPVMIFSTDCLNCIIDPCTVTSTICNCSVTNTVYRIRIVGNIPFLINKQVDTTECKSSPTSGYRVCCNKSVCVNNIVCTKCNRASAEAACAAIKELLAVCSNTTVTFNPIVTDNCANGAASFLKISGTFTLPACPTVAAES